MRTFWTGFVACVGVVGLAGGAGAAIAASATHGRSGQAPSSERLAPPPGDPDQEKPNQAEAEPEILPTGEQVIALFLQATGGAEAHKALTTRIAKGTLELPAEGLEGSISLHLKAPGMLYFTTRTPTQGTQVLGVQKDTAWEVDAAGAARFLHGDELLAAKRDAVLSPYLNLAERYQAVTTECIEDVDGQRAYRVKMQPTHGGVELHWFSVESGLEVQESGRVQLPTGEAEYVTRLSDYRDVGGVQVPFRQEQTVLRTTQIVQLHEVKHNEPIPDDQFAPPEQVRELAEAAEQE